MDLKSTLSLIVAPHFPSQGGSMPVGKGTNHLAMTVSWLPSRCLALALGDYFLGPHWAIRASVFEKKSKIQEQDIRSKIQTSKNHSREKPRKGNWYSEIKGQSASEMEQMHSWTTWRADFESSLDHLENLSGLSLQMRSFGSAVGQHRRERQRRGRQSWYVPIFKVQKPGF